MSLHRISLIGAAVALATALSASSALAQTPDSPPPSGQRAQPEMAAMIEGQLESVNATTQTLVVKTAAGKSETLRYDADTKVTGGQSGVAGLANSRGSEVTVKFRGTGEDRVATEIAIRPKKS